MSHRRIIDAILEREGDTFTNHPKDRGGPTKYGITRATLSAWRGVSVTAKDVKALTEKEARAIYASLYITLPRFDEIGDMRLRELVIDCGVHVGTARATQWLQEAAQVKADGHMGPITLQAVNSGKAEMLYKSILDSRTRHYEQIIANDPSQAVFAKGWANRVAEFVTG